MASYGTNERDSLDLTAYKFFNHLLTICPEYFDLFLNVKFRKREFPVSKEKNFDLPSGIYSRVLSSMSRHMNGKVSPLAMSFRAGLLLFLTFKSSIDSSGPFRRECEADPESMVLGQGG